MIEQLESRTLCSSSPAATISAELARERAVYRSLGNVPSYFSSVVEARIATLAAELKHLAAK